MHRRGFLILLGALAAALLVLPGPAAAQSLEQMRTSGKVGERVDGYLVACENSAQVRNFVAKVNRERQAIYTQRAEAQGVPVEQVGRVYAQQIRRSAPGDTRFVDQSGRCP